MEWHDAGSLRLQLAGAVWYRRSAVLLPLVLAVIACGWFAAGAWSLVRYALGDRVTWQASSGLLLVLFSGVQMWAAWRVHHRHLRLDRRVTPALVRSLIVGAVACYGLGLGLGPSASAEYLFRAALAGWYTLALLPWLASDIEPAWLASLAARRWARLGRYALVGVALSTLLGEAALRGLEQLADGEMATTRTLADLKLRAGSTYRGAAVNSQGYWDDEFDAATAISRFRIAALGHELTLAGTGDYNGIRQLEQRMPGLNVYNFGAPGVEPRDLALQYRRDVASHRPNLVMVFLSTGRDLGSASPASTGNYDWHNVRLLQFFTRTLRLGVDREVAVDAPAAYEAYLSWNSRWLIGCRTPQDDLAVQQWAATSRHLDRLIRRCHEHDTPVALVLVPADFQVSSNVRDKLARRVGLLPGQLDPELPQRRVTQFAAQRNIPVIDLLPVFRSSQQAVYLPNRAEMSDHGIQLAVDVVGSWLLARYGSELASAQSAAGPAVVP